MVGIIHGEVFDAEVVNTQGECSLACLMTPQACCVLHRVVSVGSKVFDELVECNDACFFEAVHAAADFEIYVSIVFDDDIVSRIVPDFLWDVFGLDSKILVVRHRSTKVEVADVGNKVTCTFFGIGDCAVDVELCILCGDSRGTRIIRVIEAITASGHAYAVGFFFLWTHVANVVGVRYFSVLRYGVFANKKYRSGAFDSFFFWSVKANAMFEEATPLI